MTKQINEEFVRTLLQRRRSFQRILKMDYDDADEQRQLQRWIAEAIAATGLVDKAEAEKRASELVSKTWHDGEELMQLLRDVGGLPPRQTPSRIKAEAVPSNRRIRGW